MIEDITGAGATQRRESLVYLVTREEATEGALIVAAPVPVNTYAVELLEAAVSIKVLGPGAVPYLVIASSKAAGADQNYTMNGLYLRGRMTAMKAGQVRVRTARTLSGIGRRVLGTSTGEAVLHETSLTLKLDKSLTDLAIRESLPLEATIHRLEETLREKDTRSRRNQEPSNLSHAIVSDLREREALSSPPARPVRPFPDLLLHPHRFACDCCSL